MERKTMSGKNADGAGVPGAEAAEVVEDAVIEEGAEAGADGAGEGVDENGEGEAVPVAEDDGEPVDHNLTPKQQESVNKRIGALTARRKAAEDERDAVKAERDELKQRVERLGDETVMRAAGAAGLLPDLIEKGDAARIDQYEQANRSVEVFGEWLEDNTDPEAELRIGERTYTRAQVRDFKRQHQKRIQQELAEVPALIERVKRETAELIRLGMQAKKSGWKPGAKAAEAAGAGGTTGKPKLPVPPVPARTALPAGGAKPRPGAATPTKKSGDGIRDRDDLALAIANGDFD
jgi:hypothetical protein